MSFIAEYLYRFVGTIIDWSHHSVLNLTVELDTDLILRAQAFCKINGTEKPLRL